MNDEVTWIITIVLFAIMVAGCYIWLYLVTVYYDTHKGEE